MYKINQVNFTEAVKSLIRIGQKWPVVDTLELVKFFENPEFKITSLKNLLNKELFRYELIALNRVVRKNFESLYYFSKLQRRIAYIFITKFTDEQLRFIITAIMKVMRINHNRYCQEYVDMKINLRYYINDYNINDLGDVKNFLGKYNRLSFFEIEAFTDLVEQLLEEHPIEIVLITLKRLSEVSIPQLKQLE